VTEPGASRVQWRKGWAAFAIYRRPSVLPRQAPARPGAPGAGALAFAEHPPPREMTPPSPQHPKRGHLFLLHYHGPSEPTLRRCDLKSTRRGRIWLTGLSGGGKSTLLATLVGLQPPTSALLLRGVLDRHLDEALGSLDPHIRLEVFRCRRGRRKRGAWMRGHLLDDLRTSRPRVADRSPAAIRCPESALQVHRSRLPPPGHGHGAAPNPAKRRWQKFRGDVIHFRSASRVYSHERDKDE